MANLINDLGNAIKSAITAASARFTTLGNTGGTLHVEYADAEAVTFPAGAAGRCLVSFVDAQHTQVYAESGETTFRFLLSFDLVDVMGSAKARAVTTQAVWSTFGDRGAEMWAQFTDNGSNRLGKSGVVLIDSISASVDGSSDRPVVEAVLAVSLWHKLPLA